MLTFETQQVFKQTGFVLAIVVIGTQAIVYYLPLINDDSVAMRQFHAGNSPSEPQ
jgi:hypothetical protein